MEDGYLITREREKIKICDMETTHLFYCLRMFWNHFAPSYYRIEPYRRYHIRMEGKVIKKKLHEIADELSGRDDLPDNLKQQLWHMSSQYHRVFENDGSGIYAKKPLLTTGSS